MSHIAKRLPRDSKAGCLITGSLQARCPFGTRMFHLTRIIERIRFYLRLRVKKNKALPGQDVPAVFFASKIQHHQRLITLSA